MGRDLRGVRKGPSETAVPGRIYSQGYDSLREGDVKELAWYSYLLKNGAVQEFVRAGRPNNFLVRGVSVPIRSQVIGGLEFFIIGTLEKYVYTPLRISQLQGEGYQVVAVAVQNV